MVVAGAEETEPAAANAAWLWVENSGNINSVRNELDEVVNGHVRPQ